MKTLLCKKSSMARGLILGLVLFMMAFVLGVSCQAYQSTPAPTPTPTPGAAGTDITVTARYASFQPSTIPVTKGQTIKLTVTSVDRSPHTFTIDELEINISVGAGQTVTKEFTVKKAGTFAFYCAVQGHRDAGMEGTLKATE